RLWRRPPGGPDRGPVSTRRHAWIDASAGVAGDMLLGALIDAGADLAVVEQTIDAVIAGSVRLSSTPVTRAGQHASRISVEVIAQDIPVREWKAVRNLIATADIAAPIRDRALTTFGRLAEAEAKIHHVPQDRVHFHEVGGLDSIADIVGVAAALHALKIDSISASAVAVGSGRAQSAHGELGVPVPAVVELATGWRIFAGGRGELTTPTGMALVSTLAERCEDLPLLTLENSGAGAGSRDVPGRPNLTRVLIGERVTHADDDLSEADVLIEANVDDLDPRLWPGVLTSLIKAGAADAWLVPIIMKKGRPAHTVSVLARADQAADLRFLLLSLTSTIGVRETRVRKTALPRGWVDLIVAGSYISIKIAHHHGTIWQVTPEFDDLERAADEQDLSPITVLEQAMSAALAAGLVAGAAVPEGLRSSRTMS
ncbi:MAG TPA: nickel pincer cofactor biosynthesis protein LarC, partial [Propionibacteriaceae bacterium]|nr:nickel pincer cofactor biosynthesis protein LarC [Propionibacteriaceae bacterium]